MLLKVSGVVRVVRDIELRYAPSGTAIASFSVVSSKKYKTKEGEQREDVTFIDCTVFSRLGEICGRYLKKGSQIYIIGDLKLDSWEDQDGNKRSKHSIIVESMQMLGPKNDSDGGSGYNNQAPTNQQNNAPIVENNNNYQSQAPFEQQNKATITNNTQQQMPMIDVNDNEIPF